jgi:DNA-binding MarR family transcriptional regulator
VPETAATRSPTRQEREAWRSFLRAHARINRRLEAELLAEEKLSYGGYDVLVQLVEAPDHRLRMAELAEEVLLSRSGVTRLVDRLERAGLVARERVDGDGRGVVAVLTEKGLETLRTASRTHLAGVVRHFVDRLDEDQLIQLGTICAKLAEGY